MQTQQEIDSFDQLIWRSERQHLYSRVEKFCDLNSIDFVRGLTRDSIQSTTSERIVYMLTFDQIPDQIFWDRADDWCQQNGRHVFVVSDNISIPYIYNNITFFSYPKLLGVTASYTDIPTVNPKTLYNCFIQRADSVRQSWFYFLHNLNLLDRGYASYLLKQLPDYSELTGKDLFDYIHLHYQLNQLPAFESAYHALRPQVPYRNFLEQENLLPLILDSKYSVVLETYVDEIGPKTYTEKSLRTLQFPTIPLLFVSRGAIAGLKSLGFEMAIDLDYIDNLNWTERQQELLKILVEDRVDFDPESLYNQCMHNRQLLQGWKTEYQELGFFDELYAKVIEL
jgi:hypothetical protein